jgi:hypothetical protein
MRVRLRGLVAVLFAVGGGAVVGCTQAGVTLPGDAGPREAGQSLHEAGAPPYDGGALPEGGLAIGGGQLVTLATGVESDVLQVDSQAVYFALIDDTQTYETAIAQVALSGGAPTTLASGQYGVHGIAVSGGNVYWVDTYTPVTEPDASTLSDGLVSGVPSGGGSPMTLASHQALPSTLAADSTNLYWSNGAGCSSSASCPGAIMTVPLSGGTPLVLASGPYFPQSLAIDGARVYWGTSDGRLMSVAKTGGTPTMLAYYRTSIGSLAVDATSLYWTTASGDIMKTPIGGGASTPLLVGVTSIGDIAVDSTNAYFTTGAYPGPNAVQKIPLDGGTPSTLWIGPDAPEEIRIDATSIYFTTSSGVVTRLSPK